MSWECKQGKVGLPDKNGVPNITGEKMLFSSNISGGRALRIAVGILLVFLVFIGGAGALSNGGGGSWAYSTDIAISNPGAALSDYQILVSFSGVAFPTGAKAQREDVKFTEGGKEKLMKYNNFFHSYKERFIVW